MRIAQMPKLAWCLLWAGAWFILGTEIFVQGLVIRLGGEPSSLCALGTGGVFMGFVGLRAVWRAEEATFGK